MVKLDEKQLMLARQEFHSFTSLGEKAFTKLKFKTDLKFFKSKGNSSFEELGCVGYNPTFKELTATIKIKRTSGYSGNLCKSGSFEYVRFYLDYQDGNGWQDMGYTGFNVHDIPTKKDCDGKNEKPIDYVVRLKINPKRYFCTKENLPKVRAILSWNSIPAPNDPNQNVGTYTWGDVKNENIQISPFKFIFPELPIFDIGTLLEKAILNPSISLNQIAATEVDGPENLKKAIKEIGPAELSFGDLASNYKKNKVEPHRFGFNLLQKAINTSDLTVKQSIADVFEAQKYPFLDSLVKLQKMNCNKDFEELFCVGADYNREALVGTLKIKKSSGYSGNLCKKGSKEYVSFYIQEENNCSWIHAGTSFVEVHDIQNIPTGGLSYSVILPYNFSKFKKRCDNPQVLKVRAVLSWNTPPTSMSCSHWGNVIDSYIQLKPSSYTGVGPKMAIVGGIPTSQINPFTGLTIPGAYFALNVNPVKDHCPFGGTVTIQGETFPGQKYKVKVTNLANGTSYYVNNDLALVDNHGNIPLPVTANSADEYIYPPFNNNIGDFIARFRPGTSDKLLITVEHLDGTFDNQVIQMDNASLQTTIAIDDGGNCSHYKKGDTIHGNFSVDVDYLDRYVLSTSVDSDIEPNPLIVGLSNVTAGHPDGVISIVTDTVKNCGNIKLVAYAKTIWDSASNNRHINRSITVCLKD